MITTILITLVITVVMASMYWQPSFGLGSYEEPKKPRRRTHEEYIVEIGDLIKKEQYSMVRLLLKKPEYPLEELPLAYWKKQLSANKDQIALSQQRTLEEIERQRKNRKKWIQETRSRAKQQLEAIESLEDILK